jgi:Flp pilus assembly protein TadD
LLSALGQAKPAPLVRSAAEGAAEAFFGAASVLSRQDGGEAAEIYLQLALYLRGDFAVARILLADILEGSRRVGEALTLYNSVDAKSPFAWSAQLRAAAALEELNRSADAIALLRKMSVEEPTRLEPLITIGDIFRGEQKFTEAAEVYGEAIVRAGNPTEQHWSLFYERGIAHERSKQWPLAEADFQQALKLAPEQPLVLNYLGYSWVERGEHLEQALGMLNRAVQLKPNDGFIVDSLGWAQFHLGRFGEAVNNLERAVELKPDDPTINDHLGDAYWRVGRKVEARFQWKRALGLKPEPGLVPAIRSKIEAGLGASAAGNATASASGGG